MVTKRKPTTRQMMRQRANQGRAAMLKARAQIPPIFGSTTHVFAAIAANGNALRQSDIYTSLGESATRAADLDAREAGMLRTFRLKTKQGSGPRADAVTFDETFPLAKEAFALARKIGKTHPIPIENRMPKESPPPASPRTHRIDLLAGSEVNTLVLATVRVLRGKTARVELEAAVPHDSLTAVERAVARLRKAKILDGGKGGVYFADAPWRPQLEKLFDAYLRLRPELRNQIRERSKAKKHHRERRHEACLFGYPMTERALTALAANGEMPRSKLASVVMLTHDHATFKPLVEAGIVATGLRRGNRDNVWVSLNAAFPVYHELRATLLALSGQPDGAVRDMYVRKTDYDIQALFDTAPLFWALLMMNALPDGEIDVTSLNRLRSKHAKYTLRGRMQWLVEQGLAYARREGMLVYYGLNPQHRAYAPLKNLLDQIANVWPNLVAAAKLNEMLKPPQRRLKDANAKKRRAKAK